MQILITHGRMARSRVLHLNRWQLVASLLGLALLLMLLSGAIYNYILLKAVREGWPILSPLVRVMQHDELAQRDRYMRENLDAMAQKVGEVQARLIKLEVVEERVANAVGVKPQELPAEVRPIHGGGSGGPYVPVAQGTTTLEALNGALDALDRRVEQRGDLFTLLESRMLESRLRALMIPTSRPVEGGVGSGFGFRTDPFTGHTALHTGLDFPAEIGTPVHAAAGGVVLRTVLHPEYGNLIEIDHGNGLVTRYAHNSRILTHTGDLVKRDQVISEVGSTGRSTGPHLHFEVLVEGVPQDPAKFLSGGAPGWPPTAALH